MIPTSPWALCVCVCAHRLGLGWCLRPNICSKQVLTWAVSVALETKLRQTQFSQAATVNSKSKKLIQFFTAEFKALYKSPVNTQSQVFLFFIFFKAPDKNTSGLRSGRATIWPSEPAMHDNRPATCQRLGLKKERRSHADPHTNENKRLTDDCPTLLQDKCTMR